MTRHFLFIGERPSKRAAAIGATWHNGRLCAKNLHDALRSCGIDPREQAYVNLHSTAEPSDYDVSDLEWALAVAHLHQRLHHDVVALGRQVDRTLQAAHIAHRSLIHPAARGSIRRCASYQEHVRLVLLGEGTKHVTAGTESAMLPDAADSIADAGLS